MDNGIHGAADTVGLGARSEGQLIEDFHRALMGRERGIAPDEALAFASVVVDLRVTQIVNGVKGVHAVLKPDALKRV